MRMRIRHVDLGRHYGLPVAVLVAAFVADSRSDLDLILTSPACARKVLAVRMGRIAGAAVAIAVLLAAPFINV
ncbi:MAG: hypothetical protein WCE27_12515, partial [Pseudolabrys sp.]